MENLFAPIAPVHEVVDGPGILKPQLARHGTLLLPGETIVSIVSTDPYLYATPLWACYTGSTLGTAGGLYPTWPAGFGIRPTAQQLNSMMMKNAGLFFDKELPQGGYIGGRAWADAQVAASFDDLWVGGPNPFPGSADPTYSIDWVTTQVRGMYPDINKGAPDLVGYPYLPYSGIYDAQLTTGDHSMVKP